MKFIASPCPCIFSKSRSYVLSRSKYINHGKIWKNGSIPDLITAAKLWPVAKRTRTHTCVGIAFSIESRWISGSERGGERATGVWLEFNLIVPFVFASVSRYTTRNPVRAGTSTPCFSIYPPPLCAQEAAAPSTTRKRLLMRVNQNGPRLVHQSSPKRFARKPIRNNLPIISHNLSSEKINISFNISAIGECNNNNNKHRKIASKYRSSDTHRSEPP